MAATNVPPFIVANEHDRAEDTLVQGLHLGGAMNPSDPASLYADSPERMLYLSILFLFAVALLILSNQRWGKKSGVQRAAPSAELPARTQPSQEPLPHWVGPEQHHGPR